MAKAAGDDAGFAWLHLAAQRRSLCVFVDESGPEPAPLLIWQDGEVIGDVLGGGETVVSPRLVEVLRAAGLTGWEAVPLRLSLELEGLGIDDYVWLRCVGRSDAPDYSSRPTKWGRRRTSVYIGFDVPGWDGSDLFHPEGTLLPLLSPKAVEVLTRAGLRDVALTPIASMETFIDEVDEPEAPAEPVSGAIRDEDEFDEFDRWLTRRLVSWRVTSSADAHEVLVDVLETPVTFSIIGAGASQVVDPSGTGVCHGITWDEATRTTTLWLGETSVPERIAQHALEVSVVVAEQ